MIKQGPGTTAFALGCFFALSLSAGCRQPTMWTPKARYGTTTGTNDFDLTSKDTDPNGSPADPRWAPQPPSLPPTQGSPCTNSHAQPYQKGCTDQTKYLVQDTGTGLNGLLCGLFGDPSSVNGHVNWTAATARGPIDWLNFAEDFDYNLLLVPDQEFGLTADNNQRPDNSGRYMEIEFDSREFAFGTNWWRDFASLAEEGVGVDDFTKVRNHLHEGAGQPYGVIYGIFGIDCEHGCRSEIHPAYAVAIQVNEASGANKWAIFARNWGDEGFCSHLNHELDLTSSQNAIHIVLPYKSAAGPKISKYEVATEGQDEIQNSSRCPSIGFLKDQGEEVTIPLPPPGQEALTEVVVEFQWPDGASPVSSKPIEKSEVMRILTARKSAAEKPGAKVGVEEHLDRLHRKFKQGKQGTLANPVSQFPREGFREAVLKPYVAKVSAAKQREALGSQNVNKIHGCPIPDAAIPQAAAPSAIQVTAKLPKLHTNKKKEWRDRAWLNDFCDAYKNASEEQLQGEPADLKAKLDRVCKDKRLKP